uniref:RGP1f n=1 Tax=Volvox carteri f. nagariensis TaxID=3068 RepID=D9CIW6_VOLCA|nr:RGP1f [Volvox carteri f. nagariensis]
MTLLINLTLSKTVFFPGELVQVCVQLLLVKELSFQAKGSERTDPSFVHSLHCPEVPAHVADSRKCVRTIFSTESAVLISDNILPPYAIRSFHMRFRLPTVLPPTFRGSIVRFFYMINVRAVYEVQRAGKMDAVVFETTASTALTVWPNNGTAAGTPVCSANLTECRKSFVDHIHQRCDDPLGLHRVGELMDTGSRLEQDSACLSFPCTLPMTGGLPIVGNSHGGLCSTGGNDGDVSVSDYVLGLNCRIRWHELQGAGARDNMSDMESLTLVTDVSPIQAYSGMESAMLPRGVIPFGINRPFDAKLLFQPSLQTCTPSHRNYRGEDGRALLELGPGKSRVVAGSRALAAAQEPELGQQSGAGGFSPFTWSPSRGSSLFDKVYVLNVGSHPLLRVLLHAPLEVPLQPGATFGGVLDLRRPIAVGTLPLPGRLEMACYGVGVLLETEELLSPVCRRQVRSLFMDSRLCYLPILQTVEALWPLRIFLQLWKWNRSLPLKVTRGGEDTLSGTPLVVRRLHAEHHELPSDSALTAFMFTLPATATPSFSTPMVSLRWVLRLELMVGPIMNFAAVDMRMGMRPQLEQLTWSLPLRLRPPVIFTR